MRSGARLARRQARKAPPMLPDFKALKRPQALDEDRLTDRIQGQHRPHYDGPDRTGCGEWSFVQANRVKPHRAALKHTHEEMFNDDVRALMQAGEPTLESWIRNCVDLYVTKSVTHRDWWREYLDRLAEGHGR